LLSTIYQRHKAYCIRFMQSLYHDQDEIKDIYQDAVITFYEKVQQPGFVLTCSIATYLSAICRNQVLKRISFSGRHPVSHVDPNGELIKNSIDPADPGEEIKNERVKALTAILKEMKMGSGNCYEILARYYYRGQSMDKIATDLHYTNADNVKNQKYRCQEKLKAMLLKRLGIRNKEVRNG